MNLRKALTKAGFDWNTGRIVYQATPGEHSPGWCGDYFLPGRYIEPDDPILDQEYDDDYGAPECPRFVARDENRMYFPVQYDGATWVDRVVIDLNWYLAPGRKTPYPGG